MIKKTPLYNIHIQHGAKMVEFAGYQMPIQYKSGIIQEHKFTRENAGIFDVSHMGQLLVEPRQMSAPKCPGPSNSVRLKISAVTIVRMPLSLAF